MQVFDKQCLLGPLGHWSMERMDQTDLAKFLPTLLSSYYATGAYDDAERACSKF